MIQQQNNDQIPNLKGSVDLILNKVLSSIGDDAPLEIVGVVKRREKAALLQSTTLEVCQWCHDPAAQKTRFTTTHPRYRDQVTDGWYRALAAAQSGAIVREAGLGILTGLSYMAHPNTNEL